MWIQLIHCCPRAGPSRPSLPIGAPGLILKIGVMIFRAPSSGARTTPVRTTARRTPRPSSDSDVSSVSRQTRARKSDPEGTGFRQLFVPTRPVIADRRALHEDLGLGLRLPDRRDDLLGRVDPAVADLRLDGRAPALREDVVAGEIDDGVAAVDLVLPAARRRRVARDDLVGPHRRIPPDLVRAPGKDHGMVSRLEERPRQVAADQSRTPRDEHTHRHPPCVRRYPQWYRSNIMARLHRGRQASRPVETGAPPRSGVSRGSRRK